MGCGRQPVVEPHRAQIGDVADVALGLGHEQQDRLAVEIGLLIGGYPDLVVVAHLQPELYLDDLGLGKFRLVEKTGTVEVVDQPHLFRAVSGDEALADNPALHERQEADLPTPLPGCRPDR